MKQRTGLLLVLVVLLVAAALPASAITRGGELDGDDHPYVGLMIATDDAGNPMWRCSGTLVSPTVYVTAGHCTEGAGGAQLWFHSDLHDGATGDPSDYDYPFVGEVAGTPHLYGEYLPYAFWFADLGVVVLDEPVELDEYASLPSVGALDELGHGRNKANVTAVGYGLQEIVEGPQCVGPEDCEGGDYFDPKYQADKTRYQANLMVVNTKGVAGIGNVAGSNSFIVSGDSKHGGTCFGDSGGPMLIDDTIVGVNSFGLNSNCAGVGGAFRIDSVDALDWINSFMGS